MTDTDFLAHVLSDGEWHSHADILRRSERERGHHFTIHSRAADLRKRGRAVQCDVRRERGRNVSFYRDLSALGETPVSSPGGRDVPLSGVSPSASTESLIPAVSSPSTSGFHDEHAATAGAETNGALATSPGVEPYRAVAAGNGGGESLPPFGDSGSTSTPGDLLLFECHIDESAGLRGAYGNEAA